MGLSPLEVLELELVLVVLADLDQEGLVVLDQEVVEVVLVVSVLVLV